MFRQGSAALNYYYDSAIILAEQITIYTSSDAGATHLDTTRTQVSGNNIVWYSNYASTQLNYGGSTYYYIAIG